MLWIEPTASEQRKQEAMDVADASIKTFKDVAGEAEMSAIDPSDHGCTKIQ
jgi:hypothetical protein